MNHFVVKYLLLLFGNANIDTSDLGISIFSIVLLDCFKEINGVLIWVTTARIDQVFPPDCWANIPEVPCELYLLLIWLSLFLIFGFKLIFVLKVNIVNIGLRAGLIGNRLVRGRNLSLMSGGPKYLKIFQTAHAGKRSQGVIS